MAHLLTYALEFRGEVATDGNVLVKRASAPPCSHVTRLTMAGVVAGFLYDDCREEAFLDALLLLTGRHSFSETATVDFGHGHQLRLRTSSRGRIDRSADDRLRHGTAVLEIADGTGQFENAAGRVTSNFVLSDTGELTDNQLGLIFLGSP
jgi:hypothetical protein